MNELFNVKGKVVVITGGAGIVFDLQKESETKKELDINPCKENTL